MSSFLLCSVGSALCIVLGQQNTAGLEAAAVLIGVGAAPVFAAGVLWAEANYERPLGGRAAAAFSVSGSVGAELVPLALGQAMEAAPAALPLSTAVGVAACAVLMAMAVGVARRARNCGSPRDEEETNIEASLS